jgi:hypothetical protein
MYEVHRNSHGHIHIQINGSYSFFFFKEKERKGKERKGKERKGKKRKEKKRKEKKRKENSWFYISMGVSTPYDINLVEFLAKVITKVILEKSATTGFLF